MPVTCKAVSTIDSVKPLSHSNYVMTCSNSSVNIWSTKIGLYLAAGYNFKKQAKQVDGSKTTCSLYWQQFAKVVDKDGVTIMVRKKLQSAYQEKPKNVEEEKKSELVSTEEEKNSEAVPDEPKKKSANGSDQENDVYDLGGLFNEADAEDEQIADASSDEDEWPEEVLLSSVESMWFNNPAKKEEEKKEEEVKKVAEVVGTNKTKKKQQDTSKKPEDEEKIV